MNRSTELRMYLDRIPRIYSNHEYLQRILKLPSYIFYLVCNALMDRVVTLDIMDKFLYDVEMEFITPKEDIDWDLLIKKMNFETIPDEFSELTGKDLFLAMFVKKFCEVGKKVNYEFFITEAKDFKEEVKRNKAISVKFPKINQDKLIRNLNLEVAVSINEYEYNKNRLRMIEKDIRRFESLKDNTKDPNSLIAINAKLKKFRSEYSKVLALVKEIEKGKYNGSNI